MLFCCGSQRRQRPVVEYLQVPLPEIIPKAERRQNWEAPSGPPLLPTSHPIGNRKIQKIAGICSHRKHSAGMGLQWK